MNYKIFSVGLGLLLIITGSVLYAAWPKYGICLQSSRYDEIVCVARRNLHFSGHFSWSINKRTMSAVMAEIEKGDIPTLVQMLGDENNRIRSLAGMVLIDLGEDGITALRMAADSANGATRQAANSALMDYKILSGHGP